MVTDVQGDELHYTLVPLEKLEQLETQREEDEHGYEEEQQQQPQQAGLEEEEEVASPPPPPHKRRALMPHWLPEERSVLHDPEHAHRTPRMPQQQQQRNEPQEQKEIPAQQQQRTSTRTNSRVPWDPTRLDDVPLPNPSQAVPAPAPAEAPAPRTSIRAFANDYRLLSKESRATGISSTLTPSTSAHASHLSSRRALALSLASRRRFDLSHSLFRSSSSNAARPTCSPFLPSPSHLVTSSGAFAPLHPDGRCMSRLDHDDVDGSVDAVLHGPSALSTSMRTLVGSALSRRAQRTHDPLPVYDAAGVERVFHGAPALREQLKASQDVHNVLSPAIRFLLADSARDAACAAATFASRDGVQNEQEEGEEEEEHHQGVDVERARTFIATNPLAAQAAITASSHVLSNPTNEERPREAMLVHTWDWTPRDHKDVDALPGKRVRAQHVEET